MRGFGTMWAASAAALVFSSLAIADPYMHLGMTYTDTIATDGVTSLGIIDPSTQHDPAYYYKFSLTLTAHDVASDADFDAVRAFFRPGAGITLATYSPANPTVDPDGPGLANPAVEAAVFNRNQVSVVTSGALAGQIDGWWRVQNSFMAYSRQLGETSRPLTGDSDDLGYPTRLGDLFVQWDGVATSDLGWEWRGGDSLVFWTGNGAGTGSRAYFDSAAESTFDTFTFAVPEPASLALLVSGGLLVGLRRRHASH